MGGGKPTEASGSVERAAKQFIIAIHKVGDDVWGYRDSSLDPGVLDRGHTAILGIASVPHQSHDIEAAFVLEQGQAPFSCGPIGLVNLGAVGVEAASTLQRQT